MWEGVGSRLLVRLLYCRRFLQFYWTNEDPVSSSTVHSLLVEIVLFFFVGSDADSMARRSKNRLSGVVATDSLQPRTHVFEYAGVNIASYTGDRFGNCHSIVSYPGELAPFGIETEHLVVYFYVFRGSWIFLKSYCKRSRESYTLQSARMHVCINIIRFSYYVFRIVHFRKS